MAKERPVDDKHCWLCEECGVLHQGVNPPDECKWCAYRYFSNLFDVKRERDLGAVH